MSLYGDYIKENRGDEIVESSIGFATYRFLDDKTVYIIDIYVKPEFRHTYAASQLADIVVLKAKKSGCKELLGTVVPTAKNSDISMKVLLGYGMKPKHITNDMLVFSKEI